MMASNSNKNLGQSLAEFAILLPVLFLMIMLIFDLGRIVYFYSAIQNAAREGARYGSIYGQDDSASIQAYARSLTAGLNQDDLQIAVPVFSAANDTIQLTVTYDYNPVTPILGLLSGSGTNDFQLSTQATMNLEYNRE